MSYILDALRRAENERARGQVPGLESQALVLAGDDEPSTPPTSRLPWAGAALLVGLALAGGAWWALRDAPAPAAALPVAASPTAAPTAALPGVMPAAAPAPAPLSAPAPAPAPVHVHLHVPAAVTAPAAAPEPIAAPAPAAAPQQAAPAPATAPTPQQTPARVGSSDAAAAPPSPSSAPAPAPRTVPLAGLSPQQRSELPAMAIGGAIYSDSPASRFVLVNGQVVREGEAAATGVTLERIGPRSLLLRWRELRIEVPY